MHIVDIGPGSSISRNVTRRLRKRIIDHLETESKLESFICLAGQAFCQKTGRCFITSKGAEWPKNTISKGRSKPDRYLIFSFEGGDAQIRLCSRQREDERRPELEEEKVAKTTTKVIETR